MASISGCPHQHMGSIGPPRFGGGPITTAMHLGPLASLAGSWSGNGFNAIWRPDNTQPPENSRDQALPRAQPDERDARLPRHPGRGAEPGVATQADLRPVWPALPPAGHRRRPAAILDRRPGLHIEPGLFMNVPASQDPDNPASIVRMASIPHGVSVLMQGPNPGTVPTLGPPVIPPIYPIAGLPVFTPAAPALGLGIQPVDLPPPAGDGLEHIVPEVDISQRRSGLAEQRPVPGVPSRGSSTIPTPS